MLRLPTVTLVLVETREHQLACLAVEECVKKIEFGDVLILTDRPLEFSPLAKYCSPRVHTVSDFPDKLGWSRCWWYDVPSLLKTSHTLNIQWDSWVADTSMWSDNYLNYSYVGAPWWYTDGKNVGNGGFSLVSTPLKRYLRANRDKFPCDTPVDDDLLCRKYRPALEDVGFVWAPEKVAHDFAFECCRPTPTSKHFGFHAMFNWPEVLGPTALEERLQLVARSKYITNPNGVIWKAFAQKYPQLAAQVLQWREPQLKESSCG